MRNVQCHDCGKRYNFDKDDFCPRCGAFTQPPPVTRIGIDGGIIRMEGINEKNHKESFVHAEYHGENRERKGSALDKGSLASVLQKAQRKTPLVQNKTGNGDLFSGLADILGSFLDGRDET